MEMIREKGGERERGRGGRRECVERENMLRRERKGGEGGGGGAWSDLG